MQITPLTPNEVREGAGKRPGSDECVQEGSPTSHSVPQRSVSLDFSVFSLVEMCARHNDHVRGGQQQVRTSCLPAKPRSRPPLPLVSLSQGECHYYLWRGGGSPRPAPRVGRCEGLLHFAFAVSPTSLSLSGHTGFSLTLRRHEISSILQ